MHLPALSVLLLAGSALAASETPKRVRNKARVAPNTFLASADPDQRNPAIAAVVVSTDSLNSMSGTFDIPTLEGSGSADIVFGLGAFGSCSSGESTIAAGIHMTTKNGPQYHAWIQPPNQARKYLTHAIKSINPGDTMNFEMGYGDDGSAGILLVNTVTNEGYSNFYEDIGTLCSPTATWGIVKTGLGQDQNHPVVNFGEVEFPSPAFGVAGDPGDWSAAEVQTFSIYNTRLKREIVSSGGSSTSITFDYVKSRCRRSGGSVLC